MKMIFCASTKTTSSTRGMSLIEILIGMALSLVIMGVAIYGFQTATRAFSAIQRMGGESESARIILMSTGDAIDSHWISGHNWGHWYSNPYTPRIFLSGESAASYWKASVFGRSSQGTNLSVFSDRRYNDSQGREYYPWEEGPDKRQQMDFYYNDERPGGSTTRSRYYREYAGMENVNAGEVDRFFVWPDGPANTNAQQTWEAIIFHHGNMVLSFQSDPDQVFRYTFLTHRSYDR